MPLKNCLLAHGALAALATSLLTQAASADLFIYVGSNGLSAEAEFTLLDSTTLQIRLRNTSTGVPDGFDGAASLLTSVAFDLGAAGINGGDPTITGGTVVIGPNSQTVNFDTGLYGPGTVISGEWGFGNAGTTNLFPNFISANTAGATPFGGPNLDGPANLDGPQGGLAANPLAVPVGGLGAIQDEIIATLTLSQAINDLSFLQNGTKVEFGSDAAFIGGSLVPAPSAAVVLVGMFLAGRRRRN